MDISKIINIVENKVNKNIYDINNIINNPTQNESTNNNGIIGVYDVNDSKLQNGMVSKNVRANTNDAMNYLANNLENDTLLGPTIYKNSLYFYWRDQGGILYSLKIDAN